MRRQALVVGFVAVVLMDLALAAPSLLRADLSSPRRVLVIAVRDHGLLTLCPGVPPTKRRGQSGDQGRDALVVAADGLYWRISVSSNDELEFGFLPRALAEPAGGSARPGRETTELGPRTIVQDTELRHEVTASLLQLGGYDIVDRVDDADEILIVEAFYLSAAGVNSGFLVQAMSDSDRTFRDAVVGIAVPAAGRSAIEMRLSSLVEDAVWEGSTLATQAARQSQATLRPASVRSLVRQFAGRERRPPAHPPVCVTGDRAIDLRGSSRDDSAAARMVVPGRDKEDDRKHVANRGLPVFSSQVFYVALPLTVRSAEGHIIEDLQTRELRIYEDDIEQRVDRLLHLSVPFDLGLLVDTSQSMAWSMREAQVAALTLIERLRPADRVMLGTFDDRVIVHAELTSDRPTLRHAVLRMEQGTTTRLYDALEFVRRERLVPFGPRRALVVLTDGIDTSSHFVSRDGILSAFSAFDAPVYIVQKSHRSIADRIRPQGSAKAASGTSIAARAFLRTLTEASGGRLFDAATVDDVSNALIEIAAELAQQYTLGYYPTRQSQDGVYRRVRVEVGRAGVQVRTRAGYRATAGSDRQAPW